MYFLFCFSALTEGTTFICGVLTQAMVEKKYGSDASVDFVPYITNPADTQDLVGDGLDDM